MTEMVEVEKKSQWARSLDEAGLLDEIEDGWSLPESLDGAPTIKVEGRPAAARGPDPAEDDWQSLSDDDTGVDAPPFGVPVPTVPPPGIGADEKSRKTPMDALRASTPAPDTIESSPDLSTGPFTKSSSPPWADEQLEPPEEPADKARSTMPFADDGEEEEKEKQDAGRSSFVEVRGRRISVVPEPAPASDSGGDIFDDPPEFRDSSATIEEGVLGVVEGEPEGGGAPEETMTVADRVFDMQEHFEMGDYTRALEIAEKVLSEDGKNLEALACREASQKTLMQMYESRIGSLGRVPVVIIDTAEVIWRNLNPSAGFVLSRVDGICSFEDVVDISGLPRFETFQILNQLLQDGIIE